MRLPGSCSRVMPFVMALAGLVPVLFPVLGTSCGSDGGGGGGSGGSGAATSNDSAVLTGDPVGSGTSVSELRRTVPVDLVAGQGNFQVGSGNISRLSTLTDSGAYLAIPLTNTSGILRCFVRADDVSWLDASGAVLDSGSHYALGSVFQSDTVATNTCLQPGETGYLLDVIAEAGLFAETARVTVMMDPDDDTTGWRLPAPIVRPTGYSVDASTAVGRLTIDFKNTGTEAAVVAGGFHQYIILDGAMLPQHWSFANTNTMPTTDLLPGAAGSTMNTSVNIYAGQGTAIRPYIDFDIPSLVAFGAAPQRNQALLDRQRAVSDARRRQREVVDAITARAGVTR